MYSVLQGYIPSISMTSKSTICFPFFCLTPFFCKTLNFFSIPLLSILSLFSTLLCPWNSLSIIFPLTDLLQFSPSIKISVCQGTNCGSCMHRPFIMLPVARVVYHQFHMGIFWGILMITGMYQVVKPYIFVYTVWCMLFLLRFRLLCHVCILACACELCIWC